MVGLHRPIPTRWFLTLTGQGGAQHAKGANTMTQLDVSNPDRSGRYSACQPSSIVQQS